MVKQWNKSKVVMFLCIFYTVECQEEAWLHQKQDGPEERQEAQQEITQD